ncbi:7194_t:CDS:2, partial [Funneliformis geosporum]
NLPKLPNLKLSPFFNWVSELNKSSWTIWWANLRSDGSMIKLGQLSFIILSFWVRRKNSVGEFSEKSDLILG